MGFSDWWQSTINDPLTGAVDAVVGALAKPIGSANVTDQGGTTFVTWDKTQGSGNPVIDVGASVTPTINGAIDAVGDAGQAVGNAINQYVVQPIQGVTQAIGGTVGTVGKFLPVILVGAVGLVLLTRK